jgi:hypothetical protein
MAQLSEEDMPKESTLKQWLFNNLEKHPIMARTIEKWNDRSINSKKRTYTWLWNKMGEQIIIRTNEVNTAQVKAAFSGGNVPGAPAVTEKKSKKDKKAKKEKGDKTQTVPAAPGVSNTSNKKDKGKGKGKDGGKAKANPKSGTSTPISKLTAAEKAKMPCMFYPTGSCFRTNCPFAHDDKNLHPNPKTAPPPKAPKAALVGASVASVIPLAASQTVPESAFAPSETQALQSRAALAAAQPPIMCPSLKQQSFMSKVFAGVAKVLPKKLLSAALMTTTVKDTPSLLLSTCLSAQQNHSQLAEAFPATSQDLDKMLPFENMPVPGCPATTDSVWFEWLGDTGAGRNMGGLNTLPTHLHKLVQASRNPVAFSTGGGPQAGKQSVNTTGSLSGTCETFIVANSPCALSMGIQVNQRKNALIWLPNTSSEDAEALPFIVKREHLNKLKLRIPNKFRNYATRLDENVPIWREKVKVTLNNVVPAMSGSVVAPDDELAQAVPEAEAAPAEAPQPDGQNDDDGEEQLAIIPSVKERLTEEAKSAAHLLTHFPKNPYCEWCSRGKMV